MRAGKGSFLVPEQLALQQVFRNRIAIDRDKRPILSQTAAMGCQGYHFFARPAFAEQKKRYVGFSDFANIGKHALHLRAAAEHVFEILGAKTLL